MYPSEESKRGNSELIHHAKKVSQMRGEFKMEEIARKYYHDWYNEFEPLDENSSTTGIEGRIHVHAIKLAMLKSAAERFDRVITKEHVERSIQECMDLMPNYRVFAGGNSGQYEKAGREIIILLLERENYTLPKKSIMFKLWANGEDHINKTIEALQGAGNIEMFTNVEEQELYLRLTDSFLERLRKK